MILHFAEWMAYITTVHVYSNVRQKRFFFIVKSKSLYVRCSVCITKFVCLGLFDYNTQHKVLKDAKNTTTNNKYPKSMNGCIMIT